VPFPVSRGEGENYRTCLFDVSERGVTGIAWYCRFLHILHVDVFPILPPSTERRCSSEASRELTFFVGNQYQVSAVSLQQHPIEQKGKEGEERHILVGTYY
jgi:hypothetical protein